MGTQLLVQTTSVNTKINQFYIGRNTSNLDKSKAFSPPRNRHGGHQLPIKKSTRDFMDRDPVNPVVLYQLKHNVRDLYRDYCIFHHEGQENGSFVCLYDFICFALTLISLDTQYSKRQRYRYMEEMVEYFTTNKNSWFKVVRSKSTGREYYITLKDLPSCINFQAKIRLLTKQQDENFRFPQLPSDEEIVDHSKNDNVLFLNDCQQIINTGHIEKHYDPEEHEDLEEDLYIV